MYSIFLSKYTHWGIPKGAKFNIDTNYEDISQECYSKIDIKKHISCHSELIS